jgi:hypothetical protein
LCRCCVLLCGCAVVLLLCCVVLCAVLCWWCFGSGLVCVEWSAKAADQLLTDHSAEAAEGLLLLTAVRWESTHRSFAGGKHQTSNAKKNHQQYLGDQVEDEEALALRAVGHNICETEQIEPEAEDHD